ncbi:two-component system histidine kinase PnpS [Crassaminicella indica]|uniref:histidine kinase n=1 Tax=Crassaminicella indica TaxID=2855394 RepID=A0ABX8RDB8_9CLOT|nr:ATP-binding protein [Crassaminicella indica]QXM07064.1 cell wall metabolism sensor histidine kinase WalK [Crassaminicella indica]
MKRKILITYVILLLIGTFATGIISHTFVKNIYISSVKEKLLTNSNLIIDTLLLKEKEEKINYFNLAQKFSRKINGRVTFIEDNGKVLADSHNNSIIFENYSNKPEIRNAIKGKIANIKRFSQITQKVSIYIANPPIKINNKNIIVRLSASLEEINHVNELFFKYMLLAIFIGMIIAVFIGYYQIDHMVKPVKELTKVTKYISKGKFHKKVKIYTNDEIGELGEHFNIMASKLNHMINEISEKNSRMDAILISIVNGIIAIDDEGKIILFNPEAERLFNIYKGNTLGKNIKDVIDHKKLLYMMKATNERKVSLEDEIEINDKILKVYTALVENKEMKEMFGVLAVIQDITEMRKLENLRKEFVSNVSHELRTPLTSISGFVETLKKWTIINESDRMKILDIIEFETERLKRLINDILKLSEIENMKLIKEKTNIDVKKSISEVLYLIKPLAENKNIQLEINIGDNLKAIVGNIDWFQQIIMNLCENAVKYTVEGGKITIKATSYDEYLFISVKDTGVGIGKEDIPRIFERFYRVDKARSRQIGGTGLGLAIVKHIVMEFNGEIEVKSEVGKGSEFIVKLPYV